MRSWLPWEPPQRAVPGWGESGSRSWFLISAARHGCLFSGCSPTCRSPFNPVTQSAARQTPHLRAESATLGRRVAQLAGPDWLVDYGGHVLTAIAIVPATPLLVPQLGGSAASELAVVRDHAVAAARELAARCDHWTVLGVQGERETSAVHYLSDKEVGTFAGFGVDVRVSPSGSTQAAVTDDSMPLPLLIAYWLRGEVGAVELTGAGPTGTGRIDAELISANADADYCQTAGRALATKLETSTLREGLLVVADGPTTLTAKAPGSFDPRAADVHEGLRAGFEAGDASYVAGLDEGLCAELGVQGRAPWQILAGVLGKMRVRASGAHSDAPYGVGYYTALWLP